MITCAIRLHFSKAKNEAKYEALLAGIDLDKAVKDSSMIIHNDSQIIIGHVNGNYETKGKHMKKYLSLVKCHVGQSLEAKFIKILKDENADVNRLAKAESSENMTINR